jgi:hypothetical protein
VAFPAGEVQGDFFCAWPETGHIIQPGSCGHLEIILAANLAFSSGPEWAEMITIFSQSQFDDFQSESGVPHA